ncbi:Proliferation-associated protein 2G4 [Cladochytrium tenue]|nr:Proliferation-associated protein 2G4 [Cladochytrium tenue]
MFKLPKQKKNPQGFSLRQFVGTELGESKARLGLVECLKHDLLTPYRIAYEREGEHTAHFIATVVVTPTGPVVLTASHWDPTKVASEKSISLPELKAILSSPIRDGAAKNPKKKKKKAQTDGQAA